jgi:tellurite resistance protein
MKRFSGNRGGILKVLLIIFGVIFVCIVLGAIYVGMHWKQWTADFANVAAQELIKDAGLPDDQRERILADIKQLGDDFKTGKITTEQLTRVVKTVSESPLVPLAGVQVARHQYIEPSDMTEAEKSAAVLTVQRFARGVFEKKIPKEAVDDVVKPIADLRQNGRWRLKEKPTRMELEQFIENCKAKADAAMIPNEPFDVNIAEELSKAIHGG